MEVGGGKQSSGWKKGDPVWAQLIPPACLINNKNLLDAKTLKPAAAPSLCGAP